MGLRVVPVTLEQANDFVRRLHRHSRPVVGCKFAIGVAADALVGVAICGRPVARLLDDGLAAEITRVCTDGTRNAASMLYGACRKALRACGHRPIYTYTLPEEGGASLRAAGFHLDKADAGNTHRAWHNRPGRTAIPVGDDLVGGKWRWIDEPQHGELHGIDRTETDRAQQDVHLPGSAEGDAPERDPLPCEG